MLAVLLAAGLAASLAQAARSTRSLDVCAEGAYRSPSGDLVVITSALPPPAEPGQRYTLLDGAQGKLSDVDAPITCRVGAIEGRTGVKWPMVELTAIPTTFAAHDGVKLYGLLLESKNPRSVPPPLIVLVHGSEKTSPILRYYQILFAGQSVSVFAYDKRGTAKSEGTYTQNFDVLADDAAAAVEEARRLAKGRYGRIGLWGGSQGGWVAPPAALKSHADFVEVAFGMVGTPIEQDRWQVDYQLGQQGFPPSILSDVHELTDATASVARSNFASHLDELNRVRTKFRSEPWFSKIDGQYSGELLQGKIEQAREESPNVQWDYPAADVLRKLTIPQLWVMAEDDSVAPSAPSIARLKALKKGGADVRIVVFPRTDHGIRLYTVGADGTRRSGRMPDGYLRLLADWAKASNAVPYGDAFEP
jgi:pimeloyl-ACP methyl ester carboxylesterase